MLKVISLLLLTLNGGSLVAQIYPLNLRCEYLINSKGIDMQNPRFYWQMNSEGEEQYQTAYQILVASSKERLNQQIGDAFDSQKVKSNQNTHVVYMGEKLKPATDYF